VDGRGICRPASSSILCPGSSCSPQSPHGILPICSGPGSSSFRESRSICQLVNHPLVLVVSPAAFRIRSAGYSAEASVMQLSCRWSSATATQAVIGPSRNRSAQIKAYCPYCRLHGRKELTEILPPTRNTTAQLGRSQPRHCEAFLRLAVVPTYAGKARGISVSGGAAARDGDGAATRQIARASKRC
jgi:hypothetical protein